MLQTLNNLPTPSADAIAHSDALRAHIQQTMTDHDPWLSFADYMDMALYAPGLGYYTAGAQKFGKGGDFVTAPVISPLFSQCLAHACLPTLQALPDAHILELGAGTGVMAKDILQYLATQNALPAHYMILEVSADLRARQQQFLQAQIPDLYPRIQWLDTLPQTFKGIILANEVLDAMPVNLFRFEQGQCFEVGVGVSNQQLVFKNKPAPERLQQAVSLLPLNAQAKIDYLSEINLQLNAFMGSLSDCLTRGQIIFIDYGFPEQEYYHVDRVQGTLMCHYRHRAHSDPFFYPGLQDITAHVDFTRVGQAAIDVNLEVETFCSQEQFLLENDLLGLAQKLSDVHPVKLSQQLQTLTAPHEMGSLFKVMVLNKDL